MNGMAQKILLFVVCLLPASLEAGELGLSVSPVWWQYEETASKYAGFASTPLQSSAQGYAAEFTAIYTKKLHDAWLFDVVGKGLLPINQASEHWNRADGVQTNQLQVLQSEFRADLMYRVSDVFVGTWVAYQWHKQSRKNFVVNGVQKDVGITVVETVQTAWLGAVVRASSDDDTINMQLDAGLPLWVHTTNSAVQGVFNKRAGFRLGADLSMLLPWQINQGALSMTAGYQYKKLGNDLHASVLWPSNTWQQVSLGVKATW